MFAPGSKEDYNEINDLLATNESEGGVRRFKNGVTTIPGVGKNYL